MEGSTKSYGIFVGLRLCLIVDIAPIKFVD